MYVALLVGSHLHILTSTAVTAGCVPEGVNPYRNPVLGFEKRIEKDPWLSRSTKLVPFRIPR